MENKLIKSGKFSLPGKKALLKTEAEWSVVIVDVGESQARTSQKSGATPRLFKTNRERAPRQTIETIVKTGNHYLAAVKGNQPKLYLAVGEQLKFANQQTFTKIEKGHRRIEKRLVSITQSDLNFPGWLNVKTIIKVESQRQTKHKA